MDAVVVTRPTLEQRRPNTKRIATQKTAASILVAMPIPITADAPQSFASHHMRNFWLISVNAQVLNILLTAIPITTVTTKSATCAGRQEVNSRRIRDSTLKRKL